MTEQNPESKQPEEKTFKLKKEVVQMAGETPEGEKRPIMETTIEFNGRGLTQATLEKMKAEPALMGDLPSRIVHAIVSAAAEQLRVTGWPKVIWRESWGNWPNAL